MIKEVQIKVKIFIKIVVLINKMIQAKQSRLFVQGQKSSSDTCHVQGLMGNAIQIQSVQAELQEKAGFSLFCT